MSFSVIVAIVGEKDSSKHLTYAQQSNLPVCLCEMKLGKSQSSLTEVSNPWAYYWLHTYIE